MTQVTSNRKPAHYSPTDYRPTLGHYHTILRARLEYFWVVPELEIKVHFVNPELEMLQAWRTLLSMVKHRLAQIERDGHDHPRPVHLTRGMARSEREVGMRAAAKALRLDQGTVRRLIEAGDLPARRTRGGKGRRGNYRITLDAILSYQARQDLAVKEASPPLHNPRHATGAKPEKLLRAGELARLAGVSRSTLYRMKCRALICGVPVTRREERFSPSAIEIIKQASRKMALPKL